MGDMKSPLNSFSDSAKKNKLEVAANTGLGISDNNPLKPAARPPKHDYNISPNILSMLEKMAKMQKEIDDKIDEAIHKQGITRSQLDTYLNDSKNFTPEQLDFIKKTRFELVNKVLAATNIPDISDTTSESPTSAKRGKVKSIGTRRNWIPTR
ncbi:MAG: hypothetical protein H0W50_01500 [Parachlamydiaceae bacterium]|nr:hypothetical protein [Parachlamydiaceae bacterium]